LVVNVATRILCVGYLAFILESTIFPHNRNWKRRTLFSKGLSNRFAVTKTAGKEKMKYIMLITGTRSNSVWKHSRVF